jgi:hypothetical protein
LRLARLFREGSYEKSEEVGVKGARRGGTRTRGQFDAKLVSVEYRTRNHLSDKEARVRKSARVIGVRDTRNSEY